MPRLFGLATADAGIRPISGGVARSTGTPLPFNPIFIGEFKRERTSETVRVDNLLRVDRPVHGAG